jgi:hypothetical protein
LFDLIDRIVSMDMGQRGMGPLYAPARARASEPLCVAAARHLTNLNRGDSVVFLTGSIVRGWVSPTIAETDGPVGVAAMARALNYQFNVLPIVLTDAPLMPQVQGVLEAAGLTVAEESVALAATQNERFTGIATVGTCASDKEGAISDARALLDRTKPKAVITVERSGMTGDGTFRNSVGQDTSAGRSLLDYVVLEAQKRGIPTIGLGDLGNEIGMGAIREAVAKHIPNGDRVCAAVGTDILYPCGVSNWGCYAIMAALAMLTGRAGLIHTVEMERLLLTEAARIGLVDGLHGKREPTADGLPTKVHLSIVELVGTIAERGLAFQKVLGDKGPIFESAQLAHYRKLML